MCNTNDTINEDNISMNKTDEANKNKIRLNNEFLILCDKCNKPMYLSLFDGRVECPICNSVKYL